MSAFRLRAPNKIRLSEADVVRQCSDYLRAKGYWVHRNPVGKYQAPSGHWATFGPPGIPDYLAIHHRHPAFFIEYKRPRGYRQSQGKLRPTQVLQFAVIRDDYGLHAVKIDSLEALIEFLQEHERSP